MPVMVSQERRGEAQDAERLAWRRSAWGAAITGQLLSLVAAWGTCRGLTAEPVGWAGLTGLACMYVTVTWLAGVLGLWLAVRRHIGHAVELAPHLSASWLFAPALVLLLRQNSLLVPAAALVTGASLAAGVCLSERRQAVRLGWRDVPQDTARRAMFEGEAESGLPPWDTVSLSIVVYVAAVTLMRGWVGLAGLLGGMFGCLLVRRLMDRESRHQSANVGWRFFVTSAVAVMLTCVASLPEMRSAVGDSELRALNAWVQSLRRSAVMQPRHVSDGGGYLGVILLPPSKKHPPIAPPHNKSSEAPALKQPLIILFDGPYWYTEAEGLPPGPKAHVAHGTPLRVRVGTADAAHIYMEAHQKLGTPLTLDCCRAIDVMVTSQPEGGASAIQLILNNSQSPGKVPLRLELQQLGQGDSSGAASGGKVRQTVRFTLPEQSSLLTFNELTVRLQTTAGRRQEGARTQIEQFVLVPR